MQTLQPIYPSHKYLESPKPNSDRLAFVIQLPDCSSERLESNAVVLSLCEAQMRALAILSQPRKRSVVQISESRAGHFASIRRLPN